MQRRNICENETKKNKNARTQQHNCECETQSNITMQKNNTIQRNDLEQRT